MDALRGGRLRRGFFRGAKNFRVACVLHTIGNANRTVEREPVVKNVINRSVAEAAKKNR